MSAYYEQVIEAAYLHSRPNCYFVGPYARRVSFVSQQHRALDLVTALDEDGRLSGKRIAIIGAGVAGITAAAALRGLDCALDLYEAAEAPLTSQMKASHRIVHPTISRWPAEPLELTTRFRVLDWAVAPCTKIICDLRDQWDEFIRPNPEEKDFKFFPKTKITQILCFDDTVTFATDPPSNPPIYDVVIVTTGFGRELEIAGVPYVSYWTPDKVDEWRRSQNQVVVSGCGDGGLIDALRLVHGSFDDGRLALELAFILDGRGEQFKNRINKIEANSLLAAKSIKCVASALKGAKSDRQVGKAFEDESVVGPMTEFYKDLADELPVEAQQLLLESYKRGGCVRGQVTLASLQSKPFGPYAAPIHKIMVAHAMKNFYIIYKRAEVLDGPMLDADPLKGNVIVRHGAHSNLETLLEAEERESLKIRQFLLADYIDKDKKDWQARHAPRRFPAEPSSKEYIRSRYNMANALVGWLKPGATLTARDDGYYLDGDDLSGCRLGVPTHLFEIPVKSTAVTVQRFF